MTERMEAGAADRAGAIIAGRYEIERALGRGGFGHTFLARDRDAARAVAIKLLDTRRTADWKAYELFEREATVLRSLRHHGIPEVYDSFRAPWDDGEAAFLVMEYVDGPSLAQVIDERRHRESAEVMHFLLELLGILEYLHDRVPPILHRDIKPANIILRPTGSPALVDFGAVRNVFRASGDSGSTVVGTYGYMPYEQYMGQATPASDLYALGATLLHLLTGRPPPDFMTDEGRLEVPEALPGDPRLATVISRLLRPSPADRFQAARDVRAALLSATALVVPGGSAVPAPHAPAVELPALPPPPRALEGPTAALLDRVAYKWWELANGSDKGRGEVGLGDVLAGIFFSVITFGVLPVVFISGAYSRRRLLRRFLRDGLPGVAQIIDIQLVDYAFGEKLARVRYEFAADGREHRDADQVLPVIADRWRAGDRIQILYIPERGYDSVIVSTG